MITAELKDFDNRERPFIFLFCIDLLLGLRELADSGPGGSRVDATLT